jgi:hypothetical protein
VWERNWNGNSIGNEKREETFALIRQSRHGCKSCYRIDSPVCVHLECEPHASGNRAEGCQVVKCVWCDWHSSAKMSLALSGHALQSADLVWTIAMQHNQSRYGSAVCMDCCESIHVLLGTPRLTSFVNRTHNTVRFLAFSFDSNGMLIESFTTPPCTVHFCCNGVCGDIHALTNETGSKK